MTTQLLLAVASLLTCHQESKSDITEKEAVEFARRIERDQADGRETAFDDLVDRDGMVEQAAAGLDLTPKEKRDFLAGYKSAGFGKAISVEQGISYHFLRARRVEGRHVLTFRVWGAGLNYHEIEIKKTAEGIRIADLYVYFSGEWIGTSVRRVPIALAAGDPERRRKLPAGAADWAKHLEGLQKFVQEAQAGDAGKALGMFNAFPETLRNDRMIQTLRILAAVRAGEAEHLKAAADFSRLFPADACRDIACLDALIVRKEYGKSFESLDRIDKAVGGDPMLDVFRGRLHLMQGKTAPAREFALKAMKNLPKIQDPHWILIEITLKEKRHTETVERLKELEKTLEVSVSPKALEDDPEYADFVKSPEYRDWKKSRASK